MLKIETANFFDKKSDIEGFKFELAAFENFQLVNVINYSMIATRQGLRWVEFTNIASSPDTNSAMLYGSQVPDKRLLQHTFRDCENPKSLLSSAHKGSKLASCVHIVNHLLRIGRLLYITSSFHEATHCIWSMYLS